LLIMLNYFVSHLLKIEKISLLKDNENKVLFVFFLVRVSSSVFIYFRAFHKHLLQCSPQIQQSERNDTNLFFRLKVFFEKVLCIQFLSVSKSYFYKKVGSKFNSLNFSKLHFQNWIVWKSSFQNHLKWQLKLNCLINTIYPNYMLC